MAFRIQQPVRHPDVDRAGIVYFPRFYDFFHRALEDFFRDEVGVPYHDLGDTLRIETEVHALRESRSRPNAGIVTFVHRAFNQRDEEVASCKRHALLLKRGSV